MIDNKIICDKCKKELLFAKDADNGTSIVKLEVFCVCGHNNIETFLGFPKLAGNDKYYFEFVDEQKIKIRQRK